jgi:hypothetical protein
MIMVAAVPGTADESSEPGKTFSVIPDALMSILPGGIDDASE